MPRVDKERPSVSFEHATSRRNLFAFADFATPPVGHTDKPAAVVQPAAATVPPVNPQFAPEPEFPFHYLGYFGRADNPIAVFAADGNIVNATIGESVAGTFRLVSVGIESVEIASPSGSLRRVGMRP